MNRSYRTKKQRYKKDTAKLMTGCLFFLSFLVLIGVLASGVFIFLNNQVQQKPIPEGIRITVSDEEAPGYHPVEYEGSLAFPVDFVKEYIDPAIFWDEGTELLTITTTDKVIRMGTDDLTYYINQEPFSLTLPVYRMEEEVYIPQNILEEIYHFHTEYQKENQAVIVDFDEQTIIRAKLGYWRQKIYDGPDKKSMLVCKTERDEEVVIFEEANGFTKIRTEKGFIGYLETKKLPEDRIIQEGMVAEEEQRELWIPENGKINMVWDQVFKLEQSADPTRRTVVTGLDVISPTWFKIGDTEGNLMNIADMSYVDWAHENGYQVWALFSNNLEGENIRTLTHETLSNTHTREKMIKQILAFAALYNLDGINLDFESISKEDGPYYVQFIRELAPYLKEAGLIFSVDMYVPSPWTEHYDMKQVGQVADYICVMVYDEHYGGSETAGSTSSLGWAEESIQNTLDRVPKEKVIMGVPFYTRLWKETTENGTIKLGTSALGMEAAYKNLAENNAEIVYDAQTGQNYGEYTIENVKYRCWLEDAESMEKRLQLVKKYDIAGTAGWKKVFETDEVWKLMEQYLKNEN